MAKQERVVPNLQESDEGFRTGWRGRLVNPHNAPTSVQCARERFILAVLRGDGENDNEKWVREMHVAMINDVVDGIYDPC